MMLTIESAGFVKSVAPTVLPPDSSCNMIANLQNNPVVMVLSEDNTTLATNSTVVVM